MGQISHRSFDDLSLAQYWATFLTKKLEEQGAEDKITINKVPLDREGESDFERESFVAAYQKFTQKFSTPVEEKRS